MTISKTLRYQVFRRDGFTCQYCGGKPPNVALTVDHVIPIALGGSDAPGNLTTACSDCNAGKSAAAPDSAQVAAVDERNKQFMDAMAQLAQVEAATENLLWFWEEWTAWGVGFNGRNTHPLPDRAPQSVSVWLDRGLTQDDIIRAIGIAMNNDGIGSEHKFRYFAGICWSMLRGRMDKAARMIGDP